MLTADQIDEVLRTVQAGDKTAIAEALRSIADLSVSLLRMIDSRRERGIAFKPSYNEQELRRALASMASQAFPPGPPMVSATIELARAIAAETGATDSAGVLGRTLARLVIDQHAELLRRRVSAKEAEALRVCSVHCPDDRQLAIATRAIAKIVVDAAADAPLSVVTRVLDEVHDFQRFESVTLNRTGGRTSRELKIVCRCGWSSTSIDRDPDADIAIAAARDLLQAHVAETIESARRRTKKMEP